MPADFDIPDFTTVDPALRRFSEKQVAVANTWATHFGLAGAQRTDFIRRYLQRTSTSRHWVVAGQCGPDDKPFVIARIGDLLQWYDGHFINAAPLQPNDRIPLKVPTQRGATALITRLLSEMRWLRSGIANTHSALLTSYCKQAHQLASDQARDDLGKVARTVPRPEQRGSHHRYFGPRTRFYLKQVGAALKGFCGQLDQEILYAVRSVRCVSPLLYNWLAAGNRERRLQALQAQPILVPLLLLADEVHWPSSSSGNYLPVPWQALAPFEIQISSESYEEGTGSIAFNRMLGHTIDEGLSLTDFLAWFFQVPAASIRYIGTCRPSRAGGALGHILREGKNSGWDALLAGAALGNRRPRTREDWKIFFLLFSQCPWESRPDHTLPSDQRSWDFNRLLTGCPSSWSDPLWPSIIANLHDFGEIYRQLGSCLQWEHVQRAKLTASKYFQRSSYHQIANKVGAFHNALIEIREALDAEKPALKESDESTQWAPLLIDGPVVVCPNGIEVVELLSPAELWAEHQALDHCIDSYDFDAYSGHCRLVSLRRDGHSLASAEIQLRRNRNEAQGVWMLRHLTCAQLRSHGNDPVPSDSAAGQAFAWLMQRLKAGAVKVNLDWPDHTKHMTRFADSHWQDRLADDVAQWVNTHLGAA